MKKLRNIRGLTMVELLCCILILLLSSALVALGANLAIRTYRECMESSEAQVLCSTLTTAISDKLRYCGSVTESTDGGFSQIFIQNVGNVEGEGEAFQIAEDGTVTLGSAKLLGSGVYPRNLKVSKLEMSYASRVFTVTLEIADQNGNVLAKNEGFQVKRINLES